MTLRASWAEGSEAESFIEIKASGDIEWWLQQAQLWVEKHSGSDRKAAPTHNFATPSGRGKSKETNGAEATA